MIEITPYYALKYFGKKVNKNIKIDIRNAKKTFTNIKEGFIIHRHLIENDYVLMNR